AGAGPSQRVHYSCECWQWRRISSASFVPKFSETTLAQRDRQKRSSCRATALRRVLFKTWFVGTGGQTSVGGRRLQQSGRSDFGERRSVDLFGCLDLTRGNGGPVNREGDRSISQNDRSPGGSRETSRGIRVRPRTLQTSRLA